MIDALLLTTSTEPECVLTFGTHKIRFRPWATPIELWRMADAKEIDVELTKRFKEAYYRSEPQTSPKPRAAKGNRKASGRRRTRPCPAP